MSAHTAGPLEFIAQCPDEDGEPAFFSILAPNGKEVANTGSGDFVTAVERANAARIVACVNACEGMRDPQQEIASLRSQRDALAAALRPLIGHCPYCEHNRKSGITVNDCGQCNDGRRALASLDGGK